MSPHKSFKIVVNSAKINKKCSGKVIKLSSQNDDSTSQLVTLKIPNFIKSLYHVSDRCLDLLEIASFVYSADRASSRGSLDTIEYQSWSRNFEFFIEVRDYNFWNQEKVKSILSEALRFMMGDNQINFNFQEGRATNPVDLFDYYKVDFDFPENSEIALFSGGLDSLAGALELLENSDKHLILASHQSSNSSKKAQKSIVEKIEQKYPGRISHFKYTCNLNRKRAVDETQRSRSFLFCSIASLVSFCTKKNDFNVFENGVTSINLLRRSDLINSRASRTTHPKTLNHLQKLFSLVFEGQFSIKYPLITKTKSDIVSIVDRIYPELLTLSVSCTKTQFGKQGSSHCGECFQCIDRRLAMFSNGGKHSDNLGVYNFDISSEVLKGEAKVIALDYIRQAIEINGLTPDSFYVKYIYDISEMLDCGLDDEELEDFTYELYRKHSSSIRRALVNIRDKDDVFSGSSPKGTIIDIINSREYLKTDVEILVERISNILLQSVGDMFASNKPNNENDLNEKISALLKSHDKKIRSECPTASFACSKVVPDHSTIDVLIESKYLRGGTSPSVANEGIAADITKYGDKTIIFVVYDPHHSIKSDQEFKGDIEAKGVCTVLIIR